MKFTIVKSVISGCGVSSNQRIKKGKILWEGVQIKNGEIIELGATHLLNHSDNPNTFLSLVDDKMYILASKTIQKHDELTINYKVLHHYFYNFHGLDIPFMKWETNPEAYQKLYNETRLLHPSRAKEIGYVYEFQESEGDVSASLEDKGTL